MDIRQILFEGLKDRLYNFEITALEEGILAGAGSLGEAAQELGVEVLYLAPEGLWLEAGKVVLQGSGDAMQIAVAEERLLGLIGKPSGVATAAYHMVHAADGCLRIVCGAWKKVPAELKDRLRSAVESGGAGLRITDEPFVYVDKNYVRMFAGIEEAVKRSTAIKGRIVAVQLRGEFDAIEEEAATAVLAGARILIVDTGDISQVKAVIAAGISGGWRDCVQIGFAGGVTLEELKELCLAGVDVVDVGRAIIDAPLLDFRLDVRGWRKN